MTEKSKHKLSRIDWMWTASWGVLSILCFYRNEFGAGAIALSIVIIGRWKQ